MNYSEIVNPIDNQRYSIFEGIGKTILKKYIRAYKKGGSEIRPLPVLRKISYKNKKHRYRLKDPQSKRILAIDEGVRMESKKTGKTKRDAAIAKKGRFNILRIYRKNFKSDECRKITEDMKYMDKKYGLGTTNDICGIQKLFDKHKIKTGQILISPDDTEQRRRALNVRRTFENLFKLKALPIVNENDTTATAEIKYGDNDRLAARVSQIIGADTLIILSDVDGLYDKSNKRKIIKTVDKIDSNINSLIDNKKNSYGSGGIGTKLDAAKICMNAGCHMYIGNGKKLNPISNMIKTETYTHFIPKVSRLDARKKWIISSLSSQGKIYIDQGAARALNQGKSLLAAGVVKIEGTFGKGENILIVDSNQKSLARGLSSFTSSEINKIKGKQSKEIENILGYLSKSEIIHKDKVLQAVGCPQCQNLGYRGRVGIFELMRMSDPIHSLVIKSASAPDIREVALEEGMSTLQGSGWNQIKRGLTTIEEVIRYADGFVGEENTEEVLSEGL